MASIALGATNLRKGEIYALQLVSIRSKCASDTCAINEHNPSLASYVGLTKQ